MAKKFPLRPISGGTNHGTRLIRYNYWRTGYGLNAPPNLDFYVVQAGEFHTKTNYLTGSFEVTQPSQFFYHLAGRATLEYPGHRLPVANGDLFIIPPQHTFTYSSNKSMKHHWFAIEGNWPDALGEPKIQLLSFGDDSEIEAMFVEMREILILRKPGYPLRAVSIFYELLARLEEISGTAAAPESTYPEAVRNAITFLRENYAVAFNAADTAAAVGLSPSHLRALFEKWLGESPRRFHTRYRIEQAKRLLSKQNLPVSEVALYLGFSDVHHFSRVFKQVTGIAPSRYSKLQHFGDQE